MCHCGDVRNNVFLYFAEKDYITYQCKRMSSLFKDVYADGHVEYIDVSRLLRYGLQACCHFSLIFSHLLQLKKEADILILLPILSANYISGRLHGLPWWPSGIYAWIFSGKKSLSANGESGCGYLEA